MNENDPEAGTTLVELLVALALLSLIALFVAQGVGSLRAMAPLAARIDAAAETAAVRDHLTRTLGEALADLPLTALAPFEGTERTMRFLAPADPILEVDGILRVTLALAPAPDGGLDLVEARGLARGDRSADEDALPGETRTVLLRGLRDARFAYAAEPEEGEPAWRADWRELGVSPALVRIEVELPRGDARRFPPLLAHPVAAPASAEKRAAAVP